MRRNLYGLTLCAMLFALSYSASAQQPKKVPRIGAFVPASASGAPQLVEALRQGLREHGYVEEQNIKLEPRYAEGNIEPLAGFAAELVRLKADVIVVGSTPGNYSCEEHHWCDSHCHGDNRRSCRGRARC